MKIELSKVFILLSLVSLLGCRKDIIDYDKAPEWLRGNAYKYLESRGNFTIFLKALELTDYKKLVNGGGLCTVFAPDDEAFSAWLAANSYTSIEDAYAADPQGLKILTGYHLIEQSFSKTMLLAFQQSAVAGVEPVDEGLAFKYKSYAKEAPVTMFDEATQKDVKVYQREKYLPVISTRLYKTRECANYEKTHRYFFPDVNWLGDEDQLYVCNAAVTEAGLPTDNGYVNIIDKVVTPRRTLYKALAETKEADFSVFLSFFDRFKNIYYDKKISEDYAAPGEKYYLLYHNAPPKAEIDLPEIASEWAYHGEDDNFRASYIRYLSETYNCFAFTDDAFKKFYRDFFVGFEDEDYSKISDMTLFYLLKSHADDHQKIILPDQFTRKGLTGQWGEEWKLDTTQVVYHEFCANGILYGIDFVLRPIVFDIITKPLFQYPKYSIVANMFNVSNEFVTLVDQEQDHYTLLIQNDDTLTNRYDMRVNYKSDVLGDEEIQYRKDGKMVAYSKEQIIQQVERHIIFGAIRDFTGPAYYGTKQEFTYVFVKGDTIYGQDGIGHTVSGESWETLNGVTYEITGQLGVNTANLITGLTSRVEYLPFFQKLQEAKLLVYDGTNWELTFVEKGERYMVFVPKDVSSAPADPVELEQWLKYFFVPVATNNLSDYILPNFGTEQTESLVTCQEAPESTPVKKVYSRLFVKFKDAESLRLVNPLGTEVVTDGKMPSFFSDGIVFTMEKPISVNK